MELGRVVALQDGRVDVAPAGLGLKAVRSGWDETASRLDRRGATAEVCLRGPIKEDSAVVRAL